MSNCVEHNDELNNREADAIKSLDTTELVSSLSDFVNSLSELVNSAKDTTSKLMTTADEKLMEMNDLKDDLEGKMSSVINFVNVVNGVCSGNSHQNDEEMPPSPHP